MNGKSGKFSLGIIASAFVSRISISLSNENLELSYLEIDEKNDIEKNFVLVLKICQCPKWGIVFRVILNSFI